MQQQDAWATLKWIIQRGIRGCETADFKMCRFDEFAAKSIDNVAAHVTARGNKTGWHSRRPLLRSVLLGSCTHWRWWVERHRVHCLLVTIGGIGRPVWAGGAKSPSSGRSPKSTKRSWPTSPRWPKSIMFKALHRGVSKVIILS